MTELDDYSCLETSTVDALREALAEVSRATQRMSDTRAWAMVAELDHARAMTALYDLFTRLEKKSQ